MNSKRTKKMPNRNFIINVLLFLIFFVILTFDCYAATCTDSDGGKSYYTQGSCVSGISGSKFTDYCTTNKEVKEFYCNPSVDQGCWNIPYSRTGYICQNGKLIVAPTCTETDGGKDYYTKGTSTSATGSTFTDSCVSSTTVKEYYCWTDQLVYNEQYSRTGYKCENGRLVIDSGTCSDTDGGDKPYIQGVVTSSISGVKSDTCGTSETKLTEYYCDSENKAAYKSYTAPEGYICSNGRFIEDSGNPITCPGGGCTEGETYINCPEDCLPPSEVCSPEGYPDSYCDILGLCNDGYVKTSTPCKKLSSIGYCCSPETVATCDTSGHTACEPEYGENSDNCPADCGLGVCIGECYCDTLDGCDKPGTYVRTSTSCEGNGGDGYCCCLEEEIGACGDTTCDTNLGENCDTCPEDCLCPGQICVNGVCVDSGGVSCTSCTQWVDQSCGGWTCTSSQMYQTRTCSPSGCTSLSTKRCVSSSSCTVDPCVGVNCGSCASCSGGNCYNYCSGADTNCGCTNCVNCNNQDDCNGAYYDDYHCSGTSCVLNTHILNTVCAGLVANVAAVSNFYNKGIPVVLLNISNPFALASGKLTLSVHNEGGVLMGSCSQTISLSNKIFFGTAVKDAHFYPWAESILSCNFHSCSEKDYYNSGEEDFYEKYPGLKILENTPSYLPSSGFVERLLPNCNALFNSLSIGFYELTAKLEVVT